MLNDRIVRDNLYDPDLYTVFDSSDQQQGSSIGKKAIKNESFTKY